MEAEASEKLLQPSLHRPRRRRQFLLKTRAYLPSDDDNLAEQCARMGAARQIFPTMAGPSEDRGVSVQARDATTIPGGNPSRQQLEHDLLT